jgi:hypothetical protein
VAADLAGLRAVVPGRPNLERLAKAKAINVWWEYVIIAAVLILGIYSFVVLTRFETRVFSRRTSRTAESVYDNYADSNRAQRKDAGDRRGQRHDGEGSEAP